MEAKPITAEGVHKRALELVEGKGKALDLGCGEGALSNSLQEAGWEVTSCDINQPIGLKEGIIFHQQDLNKPLPFEYGIYDLVTATEVIEHLENPFQFLREVNRVLKPGGQFIMSTPNIQNWYGRIIFLLAGKFPHFMKDSDYTETGHIMPLSWIMLQRMLKGMFIIENVASNQD